MYAIVAAGGKQYKVTNGDVVKFEKLEGNVGDKVVFDQVLLVSEKKVTVGDPIVAGATVEGEITEQGKDKKVIVYKYKSKTGYHKKNGHRQPITTVKIEKVILNGVELEPDKKEEKKEEKKPAKKAKDSAKKKTSKKAEEKASDKKVEEAVETVEEVKEAEEVKDEVIDANAAVEEAKEALAETEEVAEEAVEEVAETTEEAVEEVAEAAEEAAENTEA